ncbi:hypothetical protein EVAR_98968_1 [Eumeta japonica]|uniref:Uncharacterized protein n=1 Tax=Eumeta variegata TaxID=151549 RepID=A0A4C1YT68_EUMVA|nr:hypothetical protein EVAR_98968_1 [Eumeta japonica]
MRLSYSNRRYELFRGVIGEAGGVAGGRGKGGNNKNYLYKWVGLLGNINSARATRAPRWSRPDNATGSERRRARAGAGGESDAENSPPTEAGRGSVALPLKFETFGGSLRGRLDALPRIPRYVYSPHRVNSRRMQLARPGDTIAEKSEESKDLRTRNVNKAPDAVASSGAQNKREAARESCEVHSHIPASAMEALVEAGAPKEATEERAPCSPDRPKESSTRVTGAAFFPADGRVKPVALGSSRFRRRVDSEPYRYRAARAGRVNTLSTSPAHVNYRLTCSTTSTDALRDKQTRTTNPAQCVRLEQVRSQISMQKISRHRDPIPFYEVCKGAGEPSKCRWLPTSMDTRYRRGVTVAGLLEGPRVSNGRRIVMMIGWRFSRQHSPFPEIGQLGVFQGPRSKIKNTASNVERLEWSSTLWQPANSTPLPFQRDVASLCMLYRIYYGECSEELFNFVSAATFHHRSTHGKCHPKIWNYLPTAVLPIDYDKGFFENRTNSIGVADDHGQR